MTKLSVNVNKIATLRNARGQNVPNVEQVAKDIISYGAHGITVHPRPDERHIKKSDVVALRRLIEAPTEFNVEGYPSAEFFELIDQTRPDQVTLVPDPPGVLTSNAGWNLVDNFDWLKEKLNQFASIGVRTSLFVDPRDMNESQYEALQKICPSRIELYTERFARDPQRIVGEYKTVAERAHGLGIGINAGHDLSLENLSILLNEIPLIKEVSIGHALICESLYLGLEETIHRYLKILEHPRGT